ncbi:PREDICTED: uncharacterized protein LOC108378255 [Rhagoletis zephyria]|uniref:uncharacterized protein LOC108378255 n=1 Tax=Rhagoletis zephyria TaxID=28612 RepID=UPI0008113EF3|nr:PREDICTED: uncharacterized protein LOC108378255 [Rhagoletis zephyria]
MTATFGRRVNILCYFFKMPSNINIILFIVKIYFTTIQKYVELENACAESISVYRARSEFLLNMMWFCLNQQWMILTILEKPHTKMRWKLNRKGMFWEIDCQCNGEEFFRNNFRMMRSSFNKLCGLLSCLERKDTNFRKAISLEKRVAIALYALGSSSEYRSVGNMFGIAKSTVCLIVLEFCKQAWIVLDPVYLNHFPLSREKIRECMSGFNQIGFPQCIGAIDGCHIEIHPKHDGAVQLQLQRVL